MPEKKTFPKLLKKTTGGGTQEWEIWVEKLPNGHGRIVTRYGLEDGKKQESSDTVSVGKNAGKKNATTPYEQACAEAQSQWEMKKTRKGYGDTVEESAGVRGASPMLAHKYQDHAKKIDWATAFAQPKLDGFRCLVRVEGGAVTLTSRENQPLNALEHLRKEIAAAAHRIAAISDGRPLVFDGELYAHGLSINQISSACKKRSDLTEKILFHSYDVLLPDEPYHERSSLVSRFVSELASPLVGSVETVKVRSENDLMICQRDFIERGYEGAMLRHGKAGYEAGKRSAGLLKVKTFVDGEFKIVDYKFGRGGYAEVPIFVCVTDDGHTFDVTAQGTMAEKKAIGKVAKGCIGRLLTVKYQYMTKTAEPVPFFPVAKGFRS
jgi:ATP-dependent DNA ligase